MGKEQLYSDATFEEFLEACEISELDEIFYEMSTESIKRNIMISRSIMNYLKANEVRHTKYDVLKRNAVV